MNIFSKILSQHISLQSSNLSRDTIDLEYLKEWMQKHRSIFNNIHLSCNLIVIETIPLNRNRIHTKHSNGDNDASAFIHFIEEITREHSLQNNVIVFFYEKKRNIFLGLALGDGHSSQKLPTYVSYLKHHIEIQLKRRFEETTSNLQPSYSEVLKKLSHVFLISLEDKSIRKLEKILEEKREWMR